MNRPLSKRDLSSKSPRGSSDSMEHLEEEDSEVDEEEDPLEVEEATKVEEEEELL